LGAPKAIGSPQPSWPFIFLVISSVWSRALPFLVLIYLFIFGQQFFFGGPLKKNPAKIRGTNPPLP
jgi:hypothetical protein